MKISLGCDHAAYKEKELLPTEFILGEEILDKV